MKTILAFGDSNTWGLVPGSKPHVRYADDVRWTGVLQNKLSDTRVIEEGLCGRTTIFEDTYRPGRRALSVLPFILESQAPFDKAILMLGTNDCKSVYQSSPTEIAAGMEQCLVEVEKYLLPKDILLISPVLFGDEVWKKDPDFDRASITICKELKSEYQKIANRHGTRFLAASDVVKVDTADDEHLNEAGHKKLADVIADVISDTIANKIF